MDPVPRVQTAIPYIVALIVAFALPSGAAMGQARELRVGIYQNEPKVFINEAGEPAGIFVELLNEIAAQEGWTIKYIPCEWADCLAALEAGDLDLMPDVAYSEERDAKFDFHQTPVIESWSRVYVAPGLQIVNLSDLNGKRVAALDGSIQQKVFEQLMSGFGYSVTLVPAESLSDAFAMARDGKADAAVANQFFGDYFYLDYGLSATSIDFNPVKLYYAAPQGRNADLLEAMDRSLQVWASDSDSFYYKTLERWTVGTAYLLPPYAGWVVGGTAGLLILAGGMIVLLRRQVEIRTKYLRESNDALRQSEVRYQLISSVASDYVFSDRFGADTHSRTNWAAGALEEITGYTFEEFTARGGWRAIVHPDDLTQDESNLAQLRSNQKVSTEIRIIAKNGETRWAHVFARPILNERGELFEVYGAVQDITERKRAGEKLRQSAAQLAALNALAQGIARTLSLKRRIQAALDEILATIQPDVAFIFLREGEILNLAGIAPGDAQARLGVMPIHRVGSCICGLAAREGRALYSRDIHADARCTWEECKRAGLRSFAALPLRSDEEIVGIMGLASAEERDFEPQAEFLETFAGTIAFGIRNALLYEQVQRHAAELEQRVTDRTHELELAKDRAESADRVKSAFLATMSHELRTPLNSIIGFTGVLLQGLAGPLNAEQSKQMGMARDSARHLLALINDVLDISKIEAGQLDVHRAPFEMRAAIENAMKLVTPQAGKKGLSIVAAIGSNVDGVVSDQCRVEQILLNLLSNAVKFTERGEVKLECLVRDGYIETSVRDTGIGIRAEDVDKLFAPFHQIETGLNRRHEGTGLGLSICKNLTELLGGEIRVESEWGRGSAFTFTLPLT